MKILIFRTGAFGDTLITTPVVRALHNLGHKIFYCTGKRGLQVLQGNSHIEKLIEHDESISVDNLGDHIDYLKRKHHCDVVIDFCESIEVALSQHPRGADYKLPKPERIAKFNKNFYEHTYDWAEEKLGIEIANRDHRPELFFTDVELEAARKHLKPMSYNVLIGLAGSGSNKAWPWMMDFCNETSKLHPDVHFITVGDVKCQLLEDAIDCNVTKLSGEIPMRTSMALTSMVDLVICPDTGIIHAAGAYNTPKIGLLGHNTKECITKHFANDYSLESDEKLAPCSPCLYLVYDIKLQCPLGTKFGASLCMESGITPERVYEQFKKVYDKHKKRS